jgi:hypothetical protein
MENKWRFWHQALTCFLSHHQDKIKNRQVTQVGFQSL